jgi:hypothetical protein
LAETERIERLKLQLENEQATLLKTADPEDREQMRKLGEIQAQLLVIPRRIETTEEKQKDCVMPLVEVAKQLEDTIVALRIEEANHETDKAEKDILKHFPKTTNPKTGEESNPARTIASQCYMCNVIGVQSSWDTAIVTADPSQFRFYAKQNIPRCFPHLENLMLILENWFANGKSFIPPGVRRAA